VIICGSGAKPLLWTWTSIFQFSGRVWVGPGVEDTEVDDAVGVAAAVVAAAVGVGVTDVAGCVQPAARASTAQRTSADIITSVLFIPDNYMGRVFDDCVKHAKKMFQCAKLKKTYLFVEYCPDNKPAGG
jgi:hypothetical protein